MFKLETLNLQYVTDEHGQKTAVIIPMTQFEKLLEELEDQNWGKAATDALSQSQMVGENQFMSTLMEF